MTARDAFTALFGWETLTLAFYLLAGAERNKPGRAGAAQVTFAFGKVSGAALLIGLLLLATRSHSIMLASFAHVPGGAVRTTAYVLLLTGFAVKAGLVPFQIWMPRGYAAAPGPARAIMAGICVNVAFYGMWRTLALLGRPPGWLAGVLLVLGASERAARHRPRGGAEPAEPGDRLLQHREHRAHRHRLRRRADRRGDRGPASGRGRAAGRHPAGGRAHRGQVLAVHLVRRDRGGNGPRRSGGTARAGAPNPVERLRPGRGLADLGRAAAHGRFRVRVVPAGIPDAAVPGARPRLPPGARPGRRCGRPHRRLRRCHLRPPRRALLSRGNDPPRPPLLLGGPIPPDPPWEGLPASPYPPGPPYSPGAGPGGRR